jgi:DNA-binding NarL/FixJ family response regulator
MAMTSPPTGGVGSIKSPGESAMIRVFLLDDHALVRTGYRLILEREADFQVVGEAGSGEEGLPAIRKLKPHVVVCDLHLPGISGLDITERIVRGEYGTRVLIVSVQEDGPMPRRLIEAGASGYLGKGCDAHELLRALREVARRMALSRLGAEDSPFDLLSPRELEVARMLCQGMRMEEIGRRLSLSGKTVATHKYRLYEKLGIRDTVALARMAGQHGVSDPVYAI